LVSLASRSAFAVRSADPGARGGLRVELAGAWASACAPRWACAPTAAAERPAAIAWPAWGDVRRTLRARLSASYQLDDGWRLGSAVMVDALRRGNGTVVDLTFGREQRLSERTSLELRRGVCPGATATTCRPTSALTAEQAQRSGYAVYTPGAGLRDISLSIGARTELAPQWAVFYGASASRLMAASARSPLTCKRNGWGLSGGLVYRF
jgi:outer membrane protein